MSKIRTDIEKIIQKGVLAPSGDNLQPWRFEVVKNTIRIFGVISNNPEEIIAKSRQNLLTSHGALIENMVIYAHYLGYSTKVSLFPSSGDKLHMASMTLRPDTEISKDSLAPFIEARVTNRNKFIRRPLTLGQKKALESVPRELGFDVLEDLAEMAPLLRVHVFLALFRGVGREAVFLQFQWHFGSRQKNEGTLCSRYGTLPQAKKRVSLAPDFRGVAQPGSAPALGAGCREFKSLHPDQSCPGHGKVNCPAEAFDLPVAQPDRAPAF